MGPGLLVHAILMFTFATLFYKGAELENKSPWLWVLLSLATYALAVTFGFGWMGCIVMQVMLWIVITICRGLFALAHK